MGFPTYRESQGRLSLAALASGFPTNTDTTLALISLCYVVNGGNVSISKATIVSDDPASSRSSAEMEPIHLT